VVAHQFYKRSLEGCDWIHTLCAMATALFIASRVSRVRARQPAGGTRAARNAIYLLAGGRLNYVHGCPLSCGERART